MIKTAIFGATGYAGAELIKILSSHTEVDIIFAASKTYAGKSLNSIHPHAPDILLQDTEKLRHLGKVSLRKSLKSRTKEGFLETLKEASVREKELLHSDFRSSCGVQRMRFAFR